MSPGDLEIGHTTMVRRIVPGVVLILKVVPKSAKSTLVECSIYARENQASIDMSSLKSEVNWEIKQLAAKQQRILRNQEPIMSLASSVANQEALNRLLGVHMDAEKQAGGEIHPAAREQSFSREGKADDDCKRTLQLQSCDCMIRRLTSIVCRELENPVSTCSANAKGLLDW